MRPAREDLLARVQVAEERAWIDHRRPSELSAEERMALYHATMLLTSARGAIDRVTPLSILFWSRGEEIACSIHYRSAIKILVESWDLGRLRKARQLYHTELGWRKVVLPADTAHETDRLNKEGTLAEWRQATGEAWEMLASARLRDLQHTHTQYAKAMWALLLSWMSLLVIIQLHPLDPDPPGAWGPSLDGLILMAGGLGGIISRIYTMKRNDSGGEAPNWDTLFLSPTLGALSAWVGVLLLHQLGESNILGESAKLALELPVDRAKQLPELRYLPSLLSVLSIALLMGRSETLLLKTVEQLEGTKQPDTPPATPGGPTENKPTSTEHAGATHTHPGAAAHTAASAQVPHS